jgi:hypothetical protein
MLDCAAEYNYMRAHTHKYTEKVTDHTCRQQPEGLIKKEHGEHERMWLYTRPHRVVQ